jgi:hypothetical protein
MFWKFLKKNLFCNLILEFFPQFNSAWSSSNCENHWTQRWTLAVRTSQETYGWWWCRSIDRQTRTDKPDLSVKSLERSEVLVADQELGKRPNLLDLCGGAAEQLDISGANNLLMLLQSLLTVSLLPTKYNLTNYLLLCKVRYRLTYDILPCKAR